MDASRFDRIARQLVGGGTRRGVLRLVAYLPWAIPLGAPPSVDEAAAKKKHKKHKKRTKKPQPNAYGCLNVGQPCNGDSSLCCSGICEGTKPKKGKPDKSRCVAHDAGICDADENVCTSGSEGFCNLSNPNCHCAVTTGNAGFCADFSSASANCRDCAKDTDCQEEFGPGAACVFFDGLCSVICPDTGGTACMPVCSDLKT